jgi:hypothetical protein
VDGQIKKVKTQSLPQDEWKVVIHNAHEAYISWEEYLSNSERLKQNSPVPLSDGCPGTPREGFALLQGLVICGKCGRKMSPRYHGNGGCRAAYECTQARKQDGNMGVCWSVAGAAIDTAVASHVLEAINSEQLDISLAVLSELDYQAQEADKTWQLRLERAHYEADRAFRQYDATEPENRLVARTLERRWNEKLQQLTELEEAYSQAHQVQRLELTASQRQQILHLAKDIPALWHASSTTNQERKEILELLVKQVAITPIDAPERSTRIQILWHTGVTSTLYALRPTTAQRFQTPNEVIQLVEELAPGRTDTEIALELNQRGLVSGTGRAFTKASVAWIRWKFGIEKPLADPIVAKSGVSPEGYYSTSALASLRRCWNSYHLLLARQRNYPGFPRNRKKSLVVCCHT